MSVLNEHTYLCCSTCFADSYDSVCLFFAGVHNFYIHCSTGDLPVRSSQLTLVEQFLCCCGSHLVCLQQLLVLSSSVILDCTYYLSSCPKLLSATPCWCYLNVASLLSSFAQACWHIGDLPVSFGCAGGRSSWWWTAWRSQGQGKVTYSIQGNPENQYSHQYIMFLPFHRWYDKNKTACA